MAHAERMHSNTCTPCSPVFNDSAARTPRNPTRPPPSLHKHRAVTRCQTPIRIDSLILSPSNLFSFLSLSSLLSQERPSAPFGPMRKALHAMISIVHTPKEHFEFLKRCVVGESVCFYVPLAVVDRRLHETAPFG